MAVFAQEFPFKLNLSSFRNAKSPAAANTRLAALACDRAKTELKARSGAIDRAAN
jgi:hypothetical protein